MTESPKTRASLILRLRHADDAVAWEEFVEIYQPLVFRLACSKGLQEADALDLTQDVMAKVAKAINRFNPDPEQGTFRGWISRITRNLVVEFFRSKDRKHRTADDSSIQQIINSIPSEQDMAWFDVERERQIFAWAADKIQGYFQANTWEAFWRTAVEQVSIPEVAEQLNITTGAVYIARSRVMAKLKEKVQSHVDQEMSGSRSAAFQPDQKDDVFQTRTTRTGDQS